MNPLDLVFILCEIALIILGCYLLKEIKWWVDELDKFISLLEKIYKE